MDQGILYFAKGDPFIAEAELSAQRTAAVMECPIALVADRQPDSDCFETVIIDETPFEKRDKPRALKQTPYDRTIYLDSDTYLADSIDELFEILDQFELGFRRGQAQHHVPESSQLPDSFPEFNTGVIPYRSTPAVIEMLDDWEQRCLSTHSFDQRSLRPALYHSDVRFTSLPNRYNCQYQYANVVDGPVKVFHGPLVEREANRIDLREAISKLNSSQEVRLYYRWGETLIVDPQPSFLNKVRLAARHHGVRGLVAKAARKLSRKLPTR